MRFGSISCFTLVVLKTALLGFACFVVCAFFLCPGYSEPKQRNVTARKSQKYWTTSSWRTQAVRKLARVVVESSSRITYTLRGQRCGIKIKSASVIGTVVIEQFATRYAFHYASVIIIMIIWHSHNGNINKWVRLPFGRNETLFNARRWYSTTWRILCTQGLRGFLARRTKTFSWARWHYFAPSGTTLESTGSGRIWRRWHQNTKRSMADQRNRHFNCRFQGGLLETTGKWRSMRTLSQSKFLPLPKQPLGSQRTCWTCTRVPMIFLCNERTISLG